MRDKNPIVKSMAGLVLLLAPAFAAPPGRGRELKETYRHFFRIGAALNAAQFSGRDARAVAIVKAQFNTTSPENALKWESVHPRAGTYDFAAADQYVDFAEKNHMFVIGHTLVWHNQTPRWVFTDDQGKLLSRDALLDRMHDHIRTVVGRYKGRIKGWDVVNEALNEDGSLRQSMWLKIIGEDYIEKAFEYAHEADPNAELYYNEYGLENMPKRQGALKLMQRLLSEHTPIVAIGFQEHDKMDWPTVDQLDATISAFAKLGLKVNITELDVDVLPAVRRYTGDLNQQANSPNSNPYSDGLPASVQEALADRYAALFGVFVKHHEAITRVTFWGVTDDNSWLNNWPVRGRTNYPLLFDRNGNAKAAFEAVMAVARKAGR